MTRHTVFTFVISLVLLHGSPSGQARRYPLDSLTGLRLMNVTAQPASFQGKSALRVAFSEDQETEQRLGKLPRGEQARLRALTPHLVVIEGLEFSNGTIEAEMASAPAPGAPAGARGFAGIAFRVQGDAFEALYLRPTNGRADDQERRNHATQYVAHPDWTWFRLRTETPSKYESYVDLEPGVWTKIRIEVRSERARLYVHDQQQPTLIVNDLKSGANGKGSVALFVDIGTIAHFRNLTVTTADAGIEPRDAEGRTGAGHAAEAFGVNTTEVSPTFFFQPSGGGDRLLSQSSVW